eukprot:m.80644 g.80644  ORF g.80644 m.80644 type:complete len:199 (-) comp8627_c0_seq1:367-963(-)
MRMTREIDWNDFCVVERVVCADGEGLEADENGEIGKHDVGLNFDDEMKVSTMVVLGEECAGTKSIAFQFPSEIDNDDNDAVERGLERNESHESYDNDKFSFQISDEFAAFILQSRRMREERERRKEEENEREQRMEQERENMEKMQILKEEKEMFGEYFSEFCRLRAETNKEYSDQMSELGRNGRTEVPWWPNIPLNM